MDLCAVDYASRHVRCSSIIRLTYACSRAYANYCGENPNAATLGISRCAAAISNFANL
jgi:hypothetical protein